jgi:hypothetical protein
VYCPDGVPVEDAVVAALRAMPELAEITHEGRAVVFRTRL